MSALHLQEALVGEIRMGHCHLPLQQLFAALGQGGRALPKTVGVVFLRWWCFLWWCFCGGVFCGGVCVVVFVWWCFCGGVCVVVFLGGGEGYGEGNGMKSTVGYAEEGCCSNIE